jgi:uncharacterized protein (TIGR02246 family)
MRVRSGILGLVLAAAVGCGAHHFSGQDIEAIERLLDRQRQAWNRGDLRGFMAGYAQGEGLTFASGGDVERGWADTLARYQRRYPDRGTMGTLAFHIEEIRPLSADSAIVLGRFVLTQTPAAGDGVFTLIVRRRAEGWRIVHDHTSAARK